MVSSVEEIVAACDRHGDRLRGTYRALYRFDATTTDPYRAPRLERPESLEANPPDVIYPWEQIFLAAAACAGSDYPMLAAHFGIPLERVEFVVEGEFDPRGEFDGLCGFDAPPEARHCYRTLALPGNAGFTRATRGTGEDPRARAVAQHGIGWAARSSSNERADHTGNCRGRATRDGGRRAMTANADRRTTAAPPTRSVHRTSLRLRWRNASGIVYALRL